MNAIGGAASSDGQGGLSVRQPPSNLGAEQALLGALLMNNKAYEKISEFLTPQHFADHVHSRIYEEIRRKVEAGQLADVTTLRPVFENSGELSEVGGMAYFSQLLKAMTGIANAGEYGKVIYDAYLRRQLVDIAQDTYNDAFTIEDGVGGKEQIEVLEQKLFTLAAEGGVDGGVISFDRSITVAVKHAQDAMLSGTGVSGLASGLRDLDKKTGGLHGSDLIILAGRPAMGKTALATKIALGAARAVLEDHQKKHPETPVRGGVVIFSLEMSDDQLATRLLSEESRISGDRIRRGEINQADFDRYVAASRELSRLPLFIDPTPAISLSALRTRCRRLKRTKGLNLIVVDYVQLMKASAGSKVENRVQEISQITMGLKALAKELEVPVIGLSQLSRQVEQREDKRPQLSDLRESGSIEQDADMVWFVYRDEYYLAQRQPKELNFDNQEKFLAATEKWQTDMERAHNKAELIIAKQRHGPTGTIHLFFEGEFTRFGDLDHTYDAGGAPV